MAWLATHTSKTAITVLLRIAWATAGRRARYRSHVRALDRLDLGEPEDSTVELWDELAEQSLDLESR